MKKAQMLEFLFWTLVALVIFIPTILWASQFFKLGDKALNSYNQLVSIVGSIEHRGIESMPLRMDPDYLIVGFAKDADAVESVIYPAWPFDAIFSDIAISVQRPSQCDEEKSCICLCKGSVKVEGKLIKCTDTNKIICSEFENINFFKERPVGEVPFKYSKLDLHTSWRNGFFLTNTRDNTLLKNIYAIDTVLAGSKVPNTLTVYVQRYNDLVNVCINRDCITDEMIDNENKDEAIQEFNRFKAFYNSCRYQSDCGTFAIKLPERYYIFYKHPIIAEDDPIGAPGEFYLVHSEDPNSMVIYEKLDELIVKDIENNKITFNGIIDNFDGLEVSSIPYNYKVGSLSSSFALKQENGKVMIVGIIE